MPCILFSVPRRSAFGAKKSTATSIILAAMGAAEVEAQKAMFVEALGAKL
eukprot:COSAG02_NODE_47763_length_338_cov_10.292887_1_plen_49_part_10